MEIFKLVDQKSVELSIWEGWQIDILEGRLHIAVSELVKVPLFTLAPSKEREKSDIVAFI